MFLAEIGHQLLISEADKWSRWRVRAVAYRENSARGAVLWNGAGFLIIGHCRRSPAVGRHA
jgi:hypothetical protein